MSRNENSARVSPTAYYTGHVWCKNGLSDPRLDTRRGKLYYLAFEPLTRAAVRSSGGVRLETMLLQRHHILNDVLTSAIRAGDVEQVVEIAAGVSGRSLRFLAQFPDLRYVEADLPGMIEHKKSLLARAHLSPSRLRLVPIDALAAEGQLSLREAVAPLLDSKKGTAVITEGLLGYLPREGVDALWRRIAELIDVSGRGIYLFDIHLSSRTEKLAATKQFRKFLSLFVRGQTFLHFRDESDVTAALEAAGFSSVKAHSPESWPGLLERAGGGAAGPVEIVEGRRTRRSDEL